MSYVGMQNQGATCYLSALLQSLFFTPEFREELYSLAPNDIYDKNGHVLKHRGIPFELIKLFANLQNSEKTISTKRLTNSFGWNEDDVLRQHDINDLYNILLDGLNKAMPPNKRFLDKHYRGKIGRVTHCTECENQSINFEHFIQINVAVISNKQLLFNNLQQSLYSNFMDYQEILCDDNMYHCNECNEKVKATTYSRLVTLPTILIFNLNRYCYRYGKRTKLNAEFVCPKSIDLSVLMHHEYNKMDKNIINEYELFCIIVHCGFDSGSGHYQSFVRNIINNQKQNESANWLKFDDNKAGKASDTEIEKLFTNKNHQTPYMVMYRRKFMSPSNPSIPKFIQNEISK